jgi:hypothetical protein
LSRRIAKDNRTEKKKHMKVVSIADKSKKEFLSTFGCCFVIHMLINDILSWYMRIIKVLYGTCRKLLI